MDRKCPRRGQIWLMKEGKGRLVMPTTCKTYSCASCQPGLLALFRARLEIGVSRLARCAFITVTYRSIKSSMKGSPGENRALLDAAACAKDWRALLRRLKSAGQSPGNWLKVVELTLRKVPHHHLVVGPVTGTINCHGREFDVGRHLRRMESCPCLSHVWSRHWLAVTGDSYIVHARAVVSGSQAGWYLSKYMAKSHGERGALEARGFGRRWSSSRAWPGGGRLRLYQTTHGGWSSIWFHKTPLSGYLVRPGTDPELLRRDGEDFTLLLAEKRAKLGDLARLGRLTGVTFNRA